MLKLVKILRPVGNTISTTYKTIEAPFFSPFYSQFYNSGTASLAAAIIAVRNLKVDIDKPEVIVPAYGCPDLISAIIYADAVPVLVDLKTNAPFMSHKKITDAINEKTIAIIAVRFFGIAEQFKELSIISKKHNIILIEDSAQGFPINDVNTYWNGDFIILSFGRGKPVNLLGGGAVLTRNQQLMNALPKPSTTIDSFRNKIKYNLKLFLYNQSIRPIAYGLISQIPGLSIGQTIYKPLTELKSITKYAKNLLRSNMDAYPTRLNCQNKYTEILKHCNNTLLIDLPSKLEHDMSQPLLRYPILIKDYSLRNRLYEKLKPYGASLMYKKPLNEIANVNELLKSQTDTYKNASSIAHQLITLPIHEGITNKELNSITRILKEI